MPTGSMNLITGMNLSFASAGSRQEACSLTLTVVFISRINRRNRTDFVIRGLKNIGCYTKNCKKNRTIMDKKDEYVDYIVEWTPFGIVVERHWLVNKMPG